MEISPEPRINGNDGKTYPAFRPTAEEVEVLVDACHQLRHISGMSVAQIQTWLAEHGVIRSRGTVYKYLADFPCEDCPSRRTVSRQMLAAS